MTVKELREILEQLPDDMRVVTYYEDGSWVEAEFFSDVLQVWTPVSTQDITDKYEWTQVPEEVVGVSYPRPAKKMDPLEMLADKNGIILEL